MSASLLKGFLLGACFSQDTEPVGGLGHSTGAVDRWAGRPWPWLHAGFRILHLPADLW